MSWPQYLAKLKRDAENHDAKVRAINYFFKHYKKD